MLRRLSDDKTVRNALEDLLGYIHILPMNESAVRAALQSPFSDFEDALQHEAAAQSGIVEVILTRNLKDYKNATLPVLTPADFLTVAQ